MKGRTMPVKNCASDKLLLTTRRWIQSWVNNKKERLKNSVRMTQNEPDGLIVELDSKEAQLAVWEVVWDLKRTLEFARGSIFTVEDPLKVPEWESTLEQIDKLLTVDEIRARQKQAEEANCNTGK
ncbi:MAG: hypothetical protein ACOX6W_01775 [Lentisphaeria bacterium]